MHVRYLGGGRRMVMSGSPRVWTSIIGRLRSELFDTTQNLRKLEQSIVALPRPELIEMINRPLPCVSETAARLLWSLVAFWLSDVASRKGGV